MACGWMRNGISLTSAGRDLGLNDMCAVDIYDTSILHTDLLGSVDWARMAMHVSGLDIIDTELFVVDEE